MPRPAPRPVARRGRTVAAPTTRPAAGWACPTSRRRSLAVLGALVLGAACGGGAPGPSSAGPTTPLAVVRAQVDAFNRRDVASMAARVADDFLWLDVTGDSVVVTARGREALADGMRGYFRGFPDVRSTIEASTVSGPYVSIRERTTWTGEAGGERTQVALGVYEVRDGLIRRVWYWPAAR